MGFVLDLLRNSIFSGFAPDSHRICSGCFDLLWICSGFGFAQDLLGISECVRNFCSKGQVVIDFSVLDIWFRTSTFEFRASGFQLPASSFRLRASSFKLGASISELRASGFEFRAAGFELQASNCEFRAWSFGARTSAFRLL